MQRRVLWKGNWIRFSEIEKIEYSVKPKAAVCVGAEGRPFCAIRLRKRTNLSVLVTSEPDELSIPGQFARSKSAEVRVASGDLKRPQVF